MVTKQTSGDSKGIDLAPALRANYEEGNTHIYDAHSHPVGVSDASKSLVHVPEPSGPDKTNRATRESVFKYTRPSVIVGKYTSRRNGQFVTDQYRSATFYDSKGVISTIPIVKLRALSQKVY